MGFIYVFINVKNTQEHQCHHLVTVSHAVDGNVSSGKFGCAVLLYRRTDTKGYSGSKRISYSFWLIHLPWGVQWRSPVFQGL